MTFENLKIITPILKALAAEGYTQPTPIQEQAIPPILEGRDLLGCAQTGTGKTAAFAIPILQNLSECTKQENRKRIRTVQALILTPTRELAIQIGESFSAYGRNMDLRNSVIFGGVSQKNQTDELRAGVDILIATPGRLLDLIQQKYISLNQIKLFVLDEADRMLDMGFVHDMKKIIAMLPQKRQTMLFSATMPQEISKLINTILINPVKVEVTPVSSTVDIIEQSVYFVGKKEKRLLLIHLLKDKSISSVLVFSRTKHGADKITKSLVAAGIKAQAIHGDKSQGARQLALSNFKARKTRVLVATDIAARGIDVEELSHVINFDLPNIPETYVHRIGRTGRAGLEGVAISFCDDEEKEYLRDIQKLIAKKIAVVEDHPFPLSNYNPVVVAQDSARRPSDNKDRDLNKKNSNRPNPNRSSVNRSSVTRTTANRTSSNKSSSNKQNLNKQDVNNPGANRSQANKNNANRSQANKNNANRSQANKNNANRSQANKNDANRSNTNKSASNRTNVIKTRD